MIETVLGMTDLQIKLFTALGQILVAAAVGMVALRQWRTAQQQAETARNKLRLDLFEKRVETFDRIRRLLEINFPGVPNEEVSRELWDLAGPSGKIRWLFGPHVQQRFNDVVLQKLHAADKASIAAMSATNLEELKQLNSVRDQAKEELSIALLAVSEIFADSLTLLD
ncbi:TPA: hypothetical protein ACOEOC_000939 [Stenotrophomonas maltophilia]|uniref:Uncharacterized protein n=1 Tax=Stenotrophomonas maltophilia TaxID=40324 RepID=A0AAI9FZR5_STEMA|nr:hypothetical protein [Stenotrophomonas maltophilia]EKZ1925810.1 hypothetical protein [Stenotrophomonas maltophilia]EMB2744847.1 hypothetical protein [Stenotrophomonas maltophilia]MBH1684930.1 hypothetical protein [Stenotrophomonas maltophilia]MBH1815032.1 hypothetical protein [Stenotrophomonas maltophilia]MBH1821763.1 hypothetical protein [Stenotrophomonas maltophilia]